MDRALSLVFFLVLILVGVEALMHIVEHVRVIRRLEKVYRLTMPEEPAA